MNLDRITGCEFCDPGEWGHCRLEGHTDGRFWIGEGLRVFADIDVISTSFLSVMSGIRENLYT